GSKLPRGALRLLAYAWRCRLLAGGKQRAQAIERVQSVKVILRANPLRINIPGSRLRVKAEPALRGAFQVSLKEWRGDDHVGRASALRGLLEPACRRLCGQDSQRRKSRRPPCRAAYQV